MNRHEWMSSANCLGAPDGDFFNDVERDTDARIHNKQVIAAYCEPCTVKKVCLAYTLATESPAYPTGIAGGLTARQRRGLSLERREALIAAGTP